MSVFEKLINVIEKDCRLSAEAWSSRIVNSNLPHQEYIVAQTMYRTLKDVCLHIESGRNHIASNPDLNDLPDTFLPQVTNDSDSEKNEPETTVHKIDVESGVISHGAH